MRWNAERQRTGRRPPQLKTRRAPGGRGKEWGCLKKHPQLHECTITSKDHGRARAYSSGGGVAVRVGRYDDLGTTSDTLELDLGFPDGDGGLRGIFQEDGVLLFSSSLGTSSRSTIRAKYVTPAHTYRTGMGPAPKVEISFTIGRTAAHRRAGPVAVRALQVS